MIDELPAQEAIFLLRMSYTHRLDYLLRVVPPSIIVNEAQRFDTAVIDTFTLFCFMLFHVILFCFTLFHIILSCFILFYLAS
jgi:hypothetical protein